MTTDPRDHIYAVLALANEAQARLIIPHYDEDVATIFTEFATFAVKALGQRNILHVAELSVHSDITRSSWVPDWTTYSADYLSKPDILAESRFSASSYSSWDGRLTGDGQILQAQGRLVDVLTDNGCTCASSESILPLQDLGQRNSRILSELEDFINKAKKLATLCIAYPQTVSADEILCYTCSRENFRLRNLTPRPGEVVKAMYDYLESLKLDVEKRDVLRTIGIDPGTEDWERGFDAKTISYLIQHHPLLLLKVSQQDGQAGRITDAWEAYYLRVVWGSTIVRSGKGYLASVPKQCRQGDFITILYGWNTPFLLRRVSEGYQIVGECYVFGMMDGEAMTRGLGAELDFDIV